MVLRELGICVSVNSFHHGAFRLVGIVRVRYPCRNARGVHSVFEHKFLKGFIWNYGSGLREDVHVIRWTICNLRPFVYYPRSIRRRPFEYGLLTFVDVFLVTLTDIM